MASRKLLFLSKHVLLRHQLLTSQQVSGNWSRLPPNGHLSRRQFSMFDELSEKIKGEVERNQDFQKSIKEIKEKAEELKGVKEDLKVRTKQTTEQLYKQVDGVWNEAEAKAKRVYADVEEKISAAKEEVKGSFGIGNQEAAKQDSESSNNKDGSKSSFGEEKQGDAETLFNKFKSGVSSISPKVSLAFHKVKEAKPVDLVKKGYEIVKDELKGNPNRRKHLEYDAFKTAQRQNIEKSTRTDIVVLPSKQSQWSKKWEAFKNKMRGHPVFKHVSGISEPVIGKSQEIAEDMRERWETSDHPVVHKIQDISETVLGESDAAMSVKEIRRRDPTFSLPEFAAEVQEVVQPVLNAYFKGDTEVLQKYCSSHVIERCKAEHKAYKSQGIFFDHKILHVSEVEVRETKMMGETPIIIVAFQTQQVYCVRDKLGSVTEGGQDMIHTVYYAWAMQQLDPEEVGEGAPYSIWKLREIQQQDRKIRIQHTGQDRSGQASMASTLISTPLKLHHLQSHASLSWRCNSLPLDSIPSHSHPISPTFIPKGRSKTAVITCNAQAAPAAVNLAPGTPVRPTSVLVVGATGTLGRQIVRRALDEGYDVRCLVRPRPAPADFLRDWGATVVNADLSKPETIPATLVGIHTVIDCATGRPEEPIKTVDWEGKVALIQCAKAMGVQKFVFFSIHNCDKHPEVPLMEIKYCTEKFIRDSGLNHITIRLCGFMQGLIGQYAVPILEEKSVWGTDAPTRIAYMDTQDIARLTFIALRNENITGKLLTFAGPRAWTTQEVITLCERLAGQDANVTTVPVSVLRFTRQLTRLFEWTNDVADRLAFSEVLTSDVVFSAPMAETYNLLGVEAKDISSLEKYLQDYFTNILKKLKDIKAQSKQTDIYF
ncbi:NAD(P)-binding Rossmann-fold superfamily protein [Striga hermonthica]|uniref:NAD(P)-binding Rossmann-fold superfamily protein n=1 Tax=Striga hermonthica TaxID=68872 RepID=A0A9N7REA8_STRHE|nr:NAD(P)-binding Rossmann-fold superfamily protein [Striga hermonthica]